jgi:hypothetical protein
VQTITSASQNSTNQANTSNAVGVTAATTKQGETSDTEASKESQKVAFSDRAQKIQKLNEEFFEGGPRSVKITPEFIQRLQEYGFIDKSQASQLTSSANIIAAEDKSSLGQLSSFIDTYSSKLKSADSNDSFIETLNKAKSIINNFDGSKPSTLATDIKTVSAELTQYLSSHANEISEENKQQLEELNLALKIADNLKPDNLSSSKVNDYLKVLGGSF